MAFELRTHASISEIGKAAWDALLHPKDPPFLSYTWLSLLEKTGCVAPEKGWQPSHISLWEEGALVAVAPAYLKGNSEGEFVFDYSWAELSHQRLGTPYYPKLLLAVPFTPASGPRLLVREGHDEAQLLQVLAHALERLVGELDCSSAHLLFPNRAQASILATTELLHRQGVQFHWTNYGYKSFDDFLARFSSKRRHQIRRERREVLASGLEIRVHTGPSITEEVVHAMYEFYADTVSKHYWGRHYLSREFFVEICTAMPESLHIVMAWEGGKPIGGAFNILGKDALYGRYWGARAERPFLHFEVCFYTGIEECIQRGLSIFEPGAGGEHKVARGFEPTATDSWHYLKHPVLARAVGDFVARERATIAQHIEAARAEGVLKGI
ncbi:MAG: GNAT family N-acetyltransferase [Polyangiaceae bacterium]|nr:GNAT family N-acetyltransferase [Polyangiaceae bacterium]